MMLCSRLNTLNLCIQVSLSVLLSGLRPILTWAATPMILMTYDAGTTVSMMITTTPIDHDQRRQCQNAADDATGALDAPPAANFEQ